MSDSDSSIRPAFNKLTFDQCVLDTWLKMRDAEASQRVHEQFVHFINMLGLLSNHLPKEDQDALEKDLSYLYKIMDQILDMPSDKANDGDKAKRISKIKMVFMETHKPYIYGAFPRAGITRPEDSGTIDFNEVDYRIIRRIIRSHGGNPSAMRDVTEGDIEDKSKKEDDDDEAGADINGTT